MPHDPARMSSKGPLAAVREPFKLKTGDAGDFYFDDYELSVRIEQEHFRPPGKTQGSSSFSLRSPG
jgi:hypothetical protein